MKNIIYLLLGLFFCLHLISCSQKDPKASGTDSELSQLATLESFSASTPEGVLAISPAFSSQITSYTATVLDTIPKISLNWKTSNSNARVEVREETINYGERYGNVVFTLTVTAQDGVTKKEYTLEVKRIATQVSLSNLQISVGVLSPNFKNTITDYTATVAADITSIKITATAFNASACSILVNSSGVVSGTASNAISLDIGENVISIILKSNDGLNEAKYNITVTRLSPDASLSALTIDGISIFDSNANNYIYQVPLSTDSISIGVGTDSSGATITVGGFDVISGGNKTVALNAQNSTAIEVIVTAEGGEVSTTYTIMINKAIMYHYSHQWGSPGTGDGEFDKPVSLIISGDYVVLVDSGNHRLQFFFKNGVFVASLFNQGSASGNLEQPSAVKLGSGNKIFILDSGNNRVVEYTGDMNALIHYNAVGGGTGDGELQNAKGFVLLETGILIADTGNHRLQSFQVVSSTTVDAQGWYGKDETESGFWHAAGGDSTGSIFGDTDFSFKNPSAIAKDASGNYYIVDAGNHRIVKMNSTLDTILATWGKTSSGSPVSGAGSLEFNNPSGIFIDSDGCIYIADTGNHRIQKLDSSGNFMGWFGKISGGSQGGWHTSGIAVSGNENGAFSSPQSVFIDNNTQYMYVVDTGNNRVQVVKP